MVDGTDGGLENRRSKRRIEEDHPEKRKKRPRRGEGRKGRVDATRTGGRESE